VTNPLHNPICLRLHSYNNSINTWQNPLSVAQIDMLTHVFSEGHLFCTRHMKHGFLINQSHRYNLTLNIALMQTYTE